MRRPTAVLPFLPKTIHLNNGFTDKLVDISDALLGNITGCCRRESFPENYLYLLLLCIPTFGGIVTPRSVLTKGQLRRNLVVLLGQLNK